MRASYLPSAVNHEADRLPRSRDSTDWSLSDAAFKLLEAKYGPYTLDVLATSATHKRGRYFSSTAEPGTAGVNAFAHPWGNGNCWCNPPFQLLGPVMAALRWRPFFVYSPTFYGGHPGLGGKSCCRHNENSMLTGAEIKRIQLLAVRPPCLRRWRQPI